MGTLLGTMRGQLGDNGDIFGHLDFDHPYGRFTQNRVRERDLSDPMLEKSSVHKTCKKSARTRGGLNLYLGVPSVGLEHIFEPTSVEQTFENDADRITYRYD